MKKILAFLLVLMMTFACSAFADQAKVMTSFYPLYIFALNVFDGIDEIAVECMTAPQTGCLHDYQLVVTDMMKLSQSDLFIVCGAGMEEYLPEVRQQFPELQVLECSQKLTLLENCNDEGHEGHDHSVNPHTWLDIDNALKIVTAIANGGCTSFPEYAEHILNNASVYRERLTALKDELAGQLAPMSGKQVITFHEGFLYFAQAYDIKVLALVEHETENGLQPAQIAQVIRQVEEAGVLPLFTDVNSSSSAAATVAKETGADVYAFDPIVTGEYNLTAYEDAMRRNAAALLDALE